MHIISIFIAVVLIVVGATLFVYTLCNYRNYVNNKYMSFREAMDLCNLPIVTFYMDEKKFNFILDTGADTNVIDCNAIKGMKVPIVAKTQIMGMEGNYTDVIKTRLTLKYKEGNYTDDFIVHDMSAAFGNIKKESGVNVHGIVSSHFFRKYEYMLDFQKLIAYSKSKLI